MELIKTTNNKTVIISGCGGGYDIFGGLPLYFEIMKTAKKIILVNFSFIDLNISEYISQCLKNSSRSKQISFFLLILNILENNISLHDLLYLSFLFYPSYE